MYITPYNLVKRLDSYMMNLMVKPFLGKLVNSLLGAGEGRGKSEEWAEKAMREAAPWGISGPFGSTTFDAGTKEGVLALSPEQQAQVGMFTGMIPEQLAEVNRLGADPFKAGTRIYEQMVAATQPGFRDTQLSLESRMEQQGRGGLGVFGRGSPQMEALFEARERAKGGMMVDALGQAQQMRTTGINTAMGLLAPQQQAYSNLMNIANLGPGIGQSMGQIASAQGQNIASAYGANDKMIGGIMGSILGGWAQGASTPK